MTDLLTECLDLIEILNVVKKYGQFSPLLDNEWNKLSLNDHKFVLDGHALNKIPDKQVCIRLEILIIQKDIELLISTIENKSDYQESKKYSNLMEQIPTKINNAIFKNINSLRNNQDLLLSRLKGMIQND